MVVKIKKESYQLKKTGALRNNPRGPFFIEIYPVLLLIPLIDKLIIILAYGYDAYKNGLHFANSKTGLLSNGSDLAFPWEMLRFLLCFFSMVAMMYAFSFLLKFSGKKIKQFLRF